MLTKMIKTTEGVFDLGVNDLLVKFDNMAKKFAHRCDNELSGYENNTYDFDDFYQIALIEISDMFEKYDVSRGACFSTMIFRELNHRMIMIIRELEADKRKPSQQHVYINKEVEGCEVVNVIKDKDDSYFGCDFELERFLKERLTANERVLIAMAFKKDLSKSKGVYKHSLDYAINIFSDEILDVENVSRSELAEMMHISRPTLNKRISEALDKVRELAQYYVYTTQAF